MQRQSERSLVFASLFGGFLKQEAGLWIQEVAAAELPCHSVSHQISHSFIVDPAILGQ